MNLSSKRTMIYSSEYSPKAHSPKWLMFSCFFIAMLGYVTISIINNSTIYNVFNFLTYVLAIIVFLYGLKDLLEKGITIGNSFLVSFYMFLAISCFGLSALQKPKTLLDMYYFFVGPLLFYWMVSATERKQYRLKSVHVRVSLETISKLLLLLTTALYVYIFRLKGIRMFSATLKSQQASLYVVPGVSGLIDVLAWLLLMLALSVKDKKLKIAMFLVPTIGTFLNASRTLTMRIIIFLVVAFLFSQGRRVMNRKIIFRVIVACVAIIVLFGLWGNYREKVSGWSTASIGTAMQSSVNNDIINWLYSYSALNFDVLKQRVIEQHFPVQFKALFLPLIRLVAGTGAVNEYNSEVSAQIGRSLNGFNATTFMLHSVFELNIFYFVELLLLALIVSVAARLSKAVQFKGGYVYFVMCSIMTVFGNYYLDINGIYAVSMGIIICCIFKSSSRKEY